MIEILIGVLLAVTIAFGLLRTYPDSTLRWFRRMQLGAKAFYALIAVSTFAVFVWSGILYLQFLGVLILVAVLLSVLTDDSLMEVFDLG